MQTALLGNCDAEEQHYLETTALQPASFKLWPKLIKQVVKADYISGSAFLVQHLYLFSQHLPIFTVHMGCYDFPLYQKLQQYFTVQDCFATFKSRQLMQRMDRKRQMAAEIQQNSFHCCSAICPCAGAGRRGGAIVR